MAKNDGGPAFPGYTMNDDGESVVITKLAPGMTLRDYFAAKAMQQLALLMLECRTFKGEPDDEAPLLEGDLKESCEWTLAGGEKEMEANAVYVANASYALADAMLAARQKQ